MNASQIFLSYWYFFIPAYVLAALMYTFLGRLLLGLVFRAPGDNFIYKGFVKVSDPVLALIRSITPQSVPLPVLLVFAALWMLVARILFQAVMFELDLAPRISEILPATTDAPQEPMPQEPAQ